jgi:hypothetical protein
MTREEYNTLKGFTETLISTLKEKIAAADATAKDSEQKRNEYDQLMKEEYSRGRHYREVLNMLDEMNQNYYNDMKKMEKQQYNTTAQTTTDPNSIITAYNNTRSNEEVRVDGNQA